MKWKIEAFSNSDEWLAWEPDLVAANRALIESEPGIPCRLRMVIRPPVNKLKFWRSLRNQIF